MAALLALAAALAGLGGSLAMSMTSAKANVLSPGELSGAKIADSTTTKDSKTFTSPHASGIAWLNMKDFNAATAQTNSGQPMSVKVGRFTINFSVKYTDSVNGVTRRAFRR